MAITLRQLQIFSAIAETGSTTSAASEVALTQSAASAALKELEDALGARLFDRIGRRLLLNESGRALLPRARRLLENAQELERQFAKGAGAGPLRVGCSTTIGNYLMPRVLAAYGTRADISGISIRIGNTGEIVAAVAGFKLDVGFIEGPSHDSQLVAKPWLKDELVVFASPNDPLARGKASRRVGLVELRKARWLLREPGSGTREVVESALLPRLHSLQTGIEFGHSEAIKRAVVEGLGISCLSRWVVDDMLRQGALRELRTALPPLTRMFYIVHHPEKFISSSLEGFLDFSRTPREWAGSAARIT